MINWLLVVLSLCLFSEPLLAAVDTSLVNVFSYSSTNVTTSAYVQALASVPNNVGQLEVCDTSTKIVKIAKGASGSQVDLFTVWVSGCVVVPTFILKGETLWLRAVDANATTGYNVMSFLQ